MGERFAAPFLFAAFVLPEAFEARLDGFAGVLLSAKEILPLVTESPERRGPRIGLTTSVGAVGQVDIKDTNFDPRKDRGFVTKSLQNMHNWDEKPKPSSDESWDPGQPSGWLASQEL